MTPRVRVGTSGWHYMPWRGPFYPSTLAPARFLSYYARHFRAAEINHSFYRMPRPEVLRQWAETVPEDFVFAVKAHRFVTHMKKLMVDPAESLLPMLEVYEALGAKLGPVLFQLPPRWRFNCERLAQFLEMLPPGHRYAFEFRHPSWYAPEALALLRAHDAAFCVYELAGHMSPIVTTTDFAYVRLHGPEGAYAGSYSDGALKGWARQLEAWRDQGLDCYCFFDNDQLGHAAIDALRLQHLLDTRTGQAPSLPESAPADSIRSIR